METTNKKEVPGYKRLANALTKDLQRKKIHKLTLTLKSLKRKLNKK